MKEAYPIVLTPTAKGYVVYFPDFDTGTQGKDVPDAIYMARDAIGLLGIDMEDDGKPLPRPSKLADVAHEANETVTLVDVDFAEYRRQNDMRSVRRNCTLPAWLDAEATKAKINVSAVLQSALKQELHLA